MAGMGFWWGIMADPVTWMAIASVGTLAGAAISASGKMQQANAQADASRYQAQIAQNNAATYENNARYAEQAGMVRAINQSMKGRSKIGSIKAAQAANGVDVNSGSALDVRVGEARTQREEALTVQHDAELQAYGYRTQAENERASAGLYEKKARAATAGAALDAAGGLLGSASSLGFKWADQMG